MSTAFLLFFVVALLPILYMLSDSLHVNSGLSMDAYSKVFLTKRQFGLLRNSLMLGFGTTLLALVVGVPLAFIISRTDLPYRGLFKILAAAPLVIPPYVGAVAWIHLLGRAGLVNGLLMQLLGLAAPPINVYGLWGSVFVLGLFSLPYVVLIVSSSLESVDSRLEEAALVYGSRLRMIHKVTLPLVLPAIAVSGLFVFIYALSDFGVVSFLQYNTFTIEIYSHFNAFYDFQTATAYSVLLTAMVLVLFLLQRMYLGERHFTTVSSGSSTSGFGLGSLKYPALVFCIFIVFVSFLLPLLTLSYQSLHYMPLIPVLGEETSAAGLTLGNYYTAFTLGFDQILNTLLYAVAGASFAVVLGLLLAYILVRFRYSSLVESLYMIPYVVPGTVMGLGLILLWNRPSLFVYATPLIILIAYLARFTPLATKSIESSLRQVDTSLEEAALLTGRGWLTNLVKVIAPLARRGLFAAWVIVFILCMSELNTTIIVYPPGYSTLALTVFNLQHDGPPNLVAALSIVMILLTLIPVAVFYLINRRFDKLIEDAVPTFK